MESKNTIKYDIDKSAERIDDILDSSNSNFTDKDSVPSRDSLTFNNGYYVNVTSLFIDIVGSSDMTDKNKRPVLAKKYRSFISECVAIMNAEDICKEININGDCVWGIFNTPYKSDVDTVFSVAAKLNSLIKILNYKLEKKNYNTIYIGIGIDYGRALMIKAGYSGSSINEVVWMGDVVNKACKLSDIAGRGFRKPIIVSNVVYGNLNDHNKGLLSKYLENSYYEYIYEGNIVNTVMDEWYDKNCK